MHCGRDTTVGVYVLLLLTMKNEVGIVLRPTINSTLRTPIASDGYPLKSLSITLVLIRSAEERPNWRSTEYGIRLTACCWLNTLLLYQMVHHRTTLRRSGQWSATIARITTNTHTIILTTKRSSESCAIRNFLLVTLSTGKVGCRTEPLLNVFGNEVRIFLCKN